MAGNSHAGNTHGHTVAGWTGATIVFIGFCVSGVFTVMAEPVGFWAGMAIAVIGGIVGLVLRLTGHGMPLAAKTDLAPKTASES